MNTSLLYRTFVLLLASACAGSVLAQTSVDERHPLASGGRVAIDNVAGKVTVRGWDRNEVALTGTLDETLRLDVQSSRDRVEFNVVYPRGQRNGGAVLELRVPRGAELQATTVSASLDIVDVDLAGLRANTISGRLDAAGRSTDAALETVSGGLQARVATPRLRATTVSGRLAASDARGDVALETVSGRIELAAAEVSRLRANSVSGTIQAATTGLAPGGSIGLESVSGGIGLELPAAASARLRVETFSGDIASYAGEVQRPEHGPGRSLDARLGSGNGDIRIESHSGSVRVTRR